MTTIGPIDATALPLSNPLSVATQGVARQGQNFDQAVDKLESTLAAGQNAVAQQVAAPTLSSGLASVPISGTADLTDPVVSLLTAKDAYLASLKALQVTVDVQRQGIDRLGHAVTEA